MDKRRMIAANAAKLLRDGDTVNLGIGIPTLVSNYIEENKTVWIHTENGAVGVGRDLGCPWDDGSRRSAEAWMADRAGEKGSWRTGHKDLCNAGNAAITLLPGASSFDSTLSFAIARGGHLDAAILGALQVDRFGNLANWKIPGKKLNGMGGAMDLACGTDNIIVAMEHCARDGSPKIVERCTLPLTAAGCVKTIVTELCILVVSDRKLVVTAMAPGLSKEELCAKTGTELSFLSELRTMIVPSEEKTGAERDE